MNRIRKGVGCLAVAQLMIWATVQVNGDVASSPEPLSLAQIELLRVRVEHLLEKDQQFRSYLTYGTLSDSLIKEINQMGIEEQLKIMSSRESDLSDEQESLLRELQLKNDLENYEALRQVISDYGYPSPKRLGTEGDKVLALLLHPPFDQDECEDYLETMSNLLKPEVLAGRMPPKSYALFVDNILGKILRREQLFGTNKVFDSKTQQVLPPIIEDLDKTNEARREIGLAPLGEGEYRLH